MVGKHPLTGQLKSGKASHKVTILLLSAIYSCVQVPLRREDRPGIGTCASPKLPRKEVIQPHLPVRLPCYDFTPITDPTLDACLPEGLAQRLQVLPTFVV